LLNGLSDSHWFAVIWSAFGSRPSLFLTPHIRGQFFAARVGVNGWCGFGATGCGCGSADSSPPQARALQKTVGPPVCIAAACWRHFAQSSQVTADDEHTGLKVLVDHASRAA
jgi:hypothetical protein